MQLLVFGWRDSSLTLNRTFEYQHHNDMSQCNDKRYFGFYTAATNTISEFFICEMRIKENQLLLISMRTNEQNDFILFSFGSRTPQDRYANIFFRLGSVNPTIFNVGVFNRPLAINRDKSNSIWCANGPLKCINICTHAPLCKSVIFRESTLNIHSGKPMTWRTSSINCALKIFMRLWEILFLNFDKCLHNEFRWFL